MNARNSSANNSTHSEPTSPLTVSHDETLKAELAAGVLQGLDSDDVRDEVARKNRWWNRFNQTIAEKRADVEPQPESPNDDMGKVVRIDSDNNFHRYYYGEKKSLASNLLPWIAAAALGAGGIAATHFLNKPTPVVTTPVPSASDTSVTSEGR